MFVSTDEKIWEFGQQHRQHERRSTNSRGPSQLTWPRVQHLKMTKLETDWPPEMTMWKHWQNDATSQLSSPQNFTSFLLRFRQLAFRHHQQDCCDVVLFLLDVSQVLTICIKFHKTTIKTGDLCSTQNSNCRDGCLRYQGNLTVVWKDIFCNKVKTLVKCATAELVHIVRHPAVRVLPLLTRTTTTTTTTHDSTRVCSGSHKHGRQNNSFFTLITSTQLFWLDWSLEDRMNMQSIARHTNLHTTCNKCMP